jgi:Xaa-Pro aminopeptidase
VEGVNAISGERCSPHPHLYSDRVIRPGDQAFFDIIQAFHGYRTCYYRTFSVGTATHAQVDAYKVCRDYLDAAIDLVRPGTSTREIAEVWPRAQEFGFDGEEEAFALQFGHGIGLSNWEKPVISRLVSLNEEIVLEPGMVFALETYWPAKDGYSAARIEEEIVVTPTGHQIITRFPADELLVAGAGYYTASSALTGKDAGEPRWAADLGTVAPGKARVAPDPVLMPSGE